MADKRLIDANALKYELNCENAVKYGNEDAEQLHNSYSTMMRYEIADYIDDAPTIDAVEVVRCKDCIHRVRTKSTLGFSWCGKFGNVMRDADFCSWGERKMDGGASDV